MLLGDELNEEVSVAVSTFMWVVQSWPKWIMFVEVAHLDS